MTLPLSLQVLVLRRRLAQAECAEWERQAWEHVPDEIVQAALDADRALLAWFDTESAQREKELLHHNGELAEDVANAREERDRAQERMKVLEDWLESEGFEPDWIVAAAEFAQAEEEG